LYVPYESHARLPIWQTVTQAMAVNLRRPTPKPRSSHSRASSTTPVMVGRTNARNRIYGRQLMRNGNVVSFVCTAEFASIQAVCLSGFDHKDKGIVDYWHKSRLPIRTTFAQTLAKV
jgi:hypothetical protein